MHNLNLSRKNIPFTNVASNSITWLSARLEAVAFLVILNLWKSNPLNSMLISKQSHQQLNWLQVDQSQLFLKTENKIVCEETGPPSALCLGLDTLRSTTWAKRSSASDWRRALGNYPARDRERRRGKGRHTPSLKGHPGRWTHHICSQSTGQKEVVWPCLTGREAGTCKLCLRWLCARYQWGLLVCTRTREWL